jgi:large conductance mechanosensitive channel
MFKEFKEFIAKGNVIDLAVAFIIGGAFKTIISALVEKVIMPPIGLAMGGVDFKDLKIVLQDAVVSIGEKGEEIIDKAEVAIGYGAFVQTVIDFLIIAFCVFLIVRTFNKMQELRKKNKKEEEEAPAAPPEPTKEEVLLGEIRDLLKK